MVSQRRPYIDSDSSTAITITHTVGTDAQEKTAPPAATTVSSVRSTARTPVLTAAEVSTPIAAASVATRIATAIPTTVTTTITSLFGQSDGIAKCDRKKESRDQNNE